MAQDQIPMELVSNTGTRWTILNWPVKTYLTASEGGDCEGITVQWSTDSRFAAEPDNYYTNITSSVLSCDSSSQVPLTSSALWSVFIDSTYNTASNSYYYMRSFQNSSGGGRGPYSNVVSLETRSPKLYSSASRVQDQVNWGSYSTAINYEQYRASNFEPFFPGCTGSLLAFTVDSFNPNTGQLEAWSGDTNSGSAVTMSVTSGSLIPIKGGGFNYDAIQTNGATMSFSLYGSPSGSGLFQTNSIQDGGMYNWGYDSGRTPSPDPATSPYKAVIGNVQNFPCAFGTLCNDYHMRSWTTAVGILSGSMTIIGNEGYRVKYSAVSSSTNSDICFISGGVEYGQGFPTASTTINKVIGTQGNYTGANIRWTLGNSEVGVSEIPSNPAISSIGNQVTIETSPDCVFRTITFGQSYDANLFASQYGNPYSVFSTKVSGSTVLPIPSSSVLQIWSGFGYGYTPYSQNEYPQGYIGLMDNNNSASKWSLVTPVNPNTLTTSTIGYVFPETAGNGITVGILSASLAGLSGSDYTIQFVGQLITPNDIVRDRYSLLGSQATSNVIIRDDVSGSVPFLDLRNGGTAQYRYQITTGNNNQILTIMRSGSVMSVYQNLTKLTPTLGSGTWGLFNNMPLGGVGVNFGNVNPANLADVFYYQGQMNALLMYSRSLSDSELSASYDYFL